MALNARVADFGLVRLVKVGSSDAAVGNFFSANIDVVNRVGFVVSVCVFVEIFQNLFVKSLAVRTRVHARALIQDLGEFASYASVFLVHVTGVDQAVGVKRAFFLSVKHNIVLNAQMVVSVIDGNSVFVAPEALLSFIVDGSIHVVFDTLVLNVIQGVPADSVLQNEVAQTLVALVAYSLDTIFRGGNQLALSLGVEEVLVHAFGASVGVEVDCAVGDFIRLLALVSLFKQEALIVAVGADVSESLVVDLAIGNNVVGFTESVFQVEFVPANLAHVLLVFVNQAVGDVSLVAEVFFLFQVEADVAP